MAYWSTPKYCIYTSCVQESLSIPYQHIGGTSDEAPQPVSSCILRVIQHGNICAFLSLSECSISHKLLATCLPGQVQLRVWCSRWCVLMKSTMRISLWHLSCLQVYHNGVDIHIFSRVLCGVARSHRWVWVMALMHASSISINECSISSSYMTIVTVGSKTVAMFSSFGVVAM